MKTYNMNFELMTVDQMKNDDAKSYNAYEWVKKINLYTKDDTQFYKVPAGNGYDYDRFFVTYTISEGITLFAPFGYHSVLSDAGFKRVEIDLDNKELRVFGYGENEAFGLKNCRENRVKMAKMSKHLGHIFTNDF